MFGLVPSWRANFLLYLVLLFTKPMFILLSQTDLVAQGRLNPSGNSCLGPRSGCFDVTVYSSHHWIKKPWLSARKWSQGHPLSTHCPSPRRQFLFRFLLLIFLLWKSLLSQTSPSCSEVNYPSSEASRCLWKWRCAGWYTPTPGKKLCAWGMVHLPSLDWITFHSFSNKGRSQGR